MEIEYRTTKTFPPEMLRDLFLSVGWSSGQFPDRLAVAMANSDQVFSAWCDGALVGLMNALSDGVMTAYFHYLLVDPRFQDRGIGKSLVTQALDHYREYARKVLIAYDQEVEFYTRLGFQVGTGKTPLFVTFLTT